MACEEWIERISAHADGELAATEVSSVTEHLQMCEACRHQLETFRANAQRATRALTAVRARPDFAQRVMTALPESYAARTSWRERLASLVEWRPNIHHAVQAGVGVAMMAVVAAILLPTFGTAREKARQSQCMSNLKNLGLALRLYSQDYDEKLPSGIEALSHYLNNEDVFYCPAKGHKIRRKFALRDGLEHLTISRIPNPSEFVVAYEGSDGVVDKAHDGGAYFLFLDGQVRLRRDINFVSLIDTDFSDHPQRSRENATKAGRKVSYSGKADVEVARAKAALIRAEQVVEGGGGFLLKSELRRRGAKRFEADLSAKVPAEGFFAVINQLCDIGETHYRLVEGEDLTLSYAAAQTSVDQQQTSERELGQLFQRSAAAPRPLRAGSETPHSLEVQKSLQSTRGIEGEKRHELRAVQTKLVLASITLTISEPEPHKNEALWKATGALRDAMTSLRGTGQSFATVSIWLLVYVPLWLPTMLTVWLIMRRMKRASLVT